MNSNFKKRLFCKFLSTTACVVVVTAFAHESFAAPEGSLVVGGAALVTQTGPETVIQQSSNRAIIRWNSFDVAQHEKVTLQQPSANSITINRITDTKSSRIDGNISANGKLVMINPNGIVFGATSRVDVGSLVATTSDIEDDVAFMAGGPANFTKSGNQNAKIINAGTITARDAGLVGLVAPNVENSGIIQARLGKVQLASGDIHTIDLAGDGLIKLEISEAALSQSVKNIGTLQADGGEILLTAAQGRAALDAIISNHGRIQTGTIFATNGQVAQKGKVKIIAPTTKGANKTKIINGGTIVADGGTVEMIADTVHLENTSTISMAADNGGGSVYIGGARQGGSSLPTAQFVNVEAGSVIDASAFLNGNGGEVVLWSDMQTNFGGKILSNGGSISGNGGEVEVSSKGRLNYWGFTDLKAAYGTIGHLLLDPTDVLITAAPDQNMSGSLPFEPTLDDGPSILNVATLTAALGSASVTVQTSATGTQQGNITVDAPISWSSGNTLTLDAHNDIIINQAISGQNLTLIAGNDTQIGAALTGTGTLTIMPKTDSQTMGIGNASAGTLQISTAELNNITNGWNQIIFGRTDSTALMEVRAASWDDNVLLRSDTGIIDIAGTQNFGANSLSITTNADLSITAQLNGTGSLSISSLSTGVGVGVGTGQAGVVQLSDTELDFIANGWSSLTFGNTSMTGDLNVGAYTWADNLTLSTGSGILSINGTQNLGVHNLVLIADSNPVIAGDLIGTGALTFQPGSVGLTVGAGAGASGVFNIDATEFAHIQNGWNQIYLGRTDSTAAMDLMALSWLDRIRIYSGAGVISINGAQNFNNNLAVFQTDGDIALNADLSGTYNVAFLSNMGGTSIGLAGEAGTINLTAAELNHIQNGFNLIQFGSMGFPTANPITIGAYTWLDEVYLSTTTGAITFTGAQNFGANALTISSNTAVTVNAGLAGTGTLNLRSTTASATMGFGTGQAGSFFLNDASIANIANGWGNIVIGRTDGTGDINIGALTWNDNLTLQSNTSSIIIAGIQTLGANNVTFNTDGDPQINAAMNSTGILTFQGLTDATTIGFGAGQAGSLSINALDLNNADNAWSSIVVGRATQTGAINAGGFTVADPLTIRSGTGIITVGAAINMVANNLTIQTDANLAINANISGTGNINILPMTDTTSIGVGTGQAGTILIDDAEQARILNGWANIIIGRITASGAINMGSALTWNDNIFLRTTGSITLDGTQNFGANGFSIQTDSDPVFSGTLSGTGNFTLSQIAAATSIGLGDGQAGGVNLTNAELDAILNGWTSLTFGLTTATADLNIGTYTWQDNLTLRSGAGIVNINGAQNMGANNLAINTDSNLNIADALTGTGTLTINPNGNVSIGIGTGQSGTVQLNDTELAHITNGWLSLVFGSTTLTSAVNVGANTWNDAVTLRSGTGVISIAGAQNMGANNLTILTDGNLALSSALTGSGTLTIAPNGNTVFGIGTGQTGVLALNDTELNNITNGWNNIVLGNTTSTAALNVGLRTWNDNLTLNSGTGLMTIAAAQNMGANNLTITTDSNLVLNGNLTGTGILTIRGTANATPMSLGTGQTGTLNLSDTEILRLTDGWSRIDFGSTAMTGALNIGTATWNDPVRFITNTGIITVNGVQTMGANNLEISTNGNPVFNAAINGTGALTILGSAVATTIGIGDGQTGTLHLSNSDLGYLGTGWSNIIFGSNAQTGVMNIGGYSWQFNTNFRTGTGQMTINGVTNAGSHNMTFETDSNLALNAELNGTGTLAIRGSANSTGIGIGTGQAGGLALTDTELNQLSNGWLNIVFGQSASTGAVNLGARTWNDSVQVISGSGQMTVAGIQNMGANNLILETDSNLAINAALNGTGHLSVRGADAATSIGINGEPGTLALSTAEIANMTDGWGSVTIGRHEMTGAISLGTATWLNPTTFITRSDVNVSGVQTSTETSGNSLVFVTQSGIFTNTAGASGINPGGGRYLIYAVDAGSTNLGGLSPPTTINTETYFSLYPTGVVPTGDVLIYSTGAPKILLIQIDDKSKVYGDANPTFTYTFLGGLQSSDTLTDALTGYTLNAAGTSLTDNAGTTWTITGSFFTALGYTTNVLNGTMTVVQAPVLVQASTATRTYGAANPAFTINYVGLKNGETSAVFDTLATASTTANLLSNVGTYNITSSGALADNYIFNYAPNTLTITKANLSVTADDKTREYGDANPAFTLSYGGFLNGDSSSDLTTLPTITTTATATTNVGTATITLAGGTDNNYNLVLVNGTLTITKATLTATAQNAARDYGDANPALTIAYTGFKNGETSGIIDTLATTSTTATATTNVGTAIITASGAIDNNYNFTYVDGVLTINKANLSITADNKTREYGDANPALTYTYGAFKNGETSAVLDTLPTISTTATATTNVGTAAITLAGGSDGNYNYVLTDGVLTITKATLTATAQNAARDYGDANPALTVAYTGFKNGETLGVIDTLATASTTATATTNAGTAAISASGGIDDNYDFAYVDGVLTINKANLSVTAGDKTREYGDANPALTYTYGPFKNGETSAVLSTLPTISTTATGTTNVGTAAITLSGGSDTNYNYVFTNGTLTVTKTDLTITADNKTREYGDANPALTYTYGPFKNGETSVVLGTLPTISTTATNTTNVGTAAITLAGGSDGNYNYILTDGTLTITKATLNATAQNAARDYGDANPALSIIYTGFKNGENSGVIDTLATVSTVATNTTNAGTAVISATGANDSNYDFAYVDGVLTINKANLSVIADNKTREYGNANPALTYTYGAFKNGETSTVLGTAPTISTAADLTTNAGTSAITLSGGSDTNYNYVFTNGVMTITKAAITVQVDDATRAEGAANPAFTYTVLTGLKNGDSNNVLSNVNYSSGTDKYTPRGTYTLNASGGVATNYYVLSYTSGIYTITPGELPIKALPSTVYYSNNLGVNESWDQWRDLIYYEDDNFLESVIFGRQVPQRDYTQDQFTDSENSLISCHQSLGTLCHPPPIERRNKL